MDEEAFNKKFKLNKSWYISLFVVSWFIKKLGFVKIIFVFSQHFFQYFFSGGKGRGYPTLLISWIINVNVRKVVVESTFKETDNLMKHDDEQTLESFQEVLKRKPASIKTLEDEVISIFDNPAQIQQIITESMTFEIQPKCKLT